MKQREPIYLLSAVVAAVLLLCLSSALASIYAAPSPQGADVLQATPTAPRLVYPAVRRLRVNSLFDHNNPGYNNSDVNGTIVAHTGDAVSGSPYATPGASDSSCWWAGSKLVCGYTDGDSDVKDLRWHNWVPGWLWYDRHGAYDLMKPAPTVVMTAIAAVYGSVRWKSPNDGLEVCTGDCEDCFRPYYYHVPTRVPDGTIVDPGDAVGSTRNDHLHFGVHRPGTNWGIIDPFGWQGSGSDPWQYDVGNLWASGDPIPMGYRDQNHNVHGPYALDYASIRQKWFDLDGEPGSPLDNDYAGALVRQSSDGTALYERIQPFEHGYINYVSGSGTDYYPYAETYLPDVRASESSSGWNSTIIVRNEGAGSATVNVTFYSDDGRVLDSRTHRSVPSRGVWILDVRDALLWRIDKSGPGSTTH